MIECPVCGYENVVPLSDDIIHEKLKHYNDSLRFEVDCCGCPTSLIIFAMPDIQFKVRLKP